MTRNTSETLLPLPVVGDGLSTTYDGFRHETLDYLTIVMIGNRGD